MRLTMSDALVRYLMAQSLEEDEQNTPLFAGCFAIFGHGNVCGLGEALHKHQASFPTYRAHNEQAMAHSATAFAKANRRRKIMACTTSIGPGATNLLTAAATAHLNRLPLLLLPGDIFATRKPDPVLQQLEYSLGPDVSVNDSFRTVCRYFDRIWRPEQLVRSLPEAVRVLLDPAETGPVCLSLPQDTQAEFYDYPEEFFEPQSWRLGRPLAEPELIDELSVALKSAKKPLVLVGGGLGYSQSEKILEELLDSSGLFMCETQAGKGWISAEHAQNLGGVGVTGTKAANQALAEADLLLAIGSRLSDFPTASRTIIPREGLKLYSINVNSFDAAKHGAQTITADAGRAVVQLRVELGDYRVQGSWVGQCQKWRSEWQALRLSVLEPKGKPLPTDAQVLGQLNRLVSKDTTVVAAAGGLPGELHKLWHCPGPDTYHLEYGYSCMGYEIAGGLGVKLAQPGREVMVLVGDGSYLMLNSEIATSVALGTKLIVVLFDNRGFGCIHRLQTGSGLSEFNNLLAPAAPEVDFVAHAEALGAKAYRVDSLAELPNYLAQAREEPRTAVLVVRTEAQQGTAVGGADWWVPKAGETDEH